MRPSIVRGTLRIKNFGFSIGIGKPSLWIGQTHTAPTSRGFTTCAVSASSRHATMGKKWNGDTSNNTPSMSKKPCRTCGREMTPDPRQIAIGNQVETCSHSCRTFKVGKKTNQAIVTAETLSLLRDKLQESDSSRSRYVGCAIEQLIRLASHGSSLDSTPALHPIDVDAWIELVILALAPSSSSTSNFPVGEDVEEALRDIVRLEEEALDKAMTDQSSTTASPKRTLGTILESGPGSRERVRRSLRRLSMLPRDKWACCDLVVDEGSRGIDVLQKGKVLDGLAGVSFAKGPMQFRARSQ